MLSFSLIAAAAPAPGISEMFGGMVPIFLILGIFYFVLFLPIRKQRKALQKMVDELKKGDRVVTNGGLHGEVSKVEGSTVLLKIADNVRVRITKSAVAGQQDAAEDGGVK